jgi:hypothetical protein
MARRFSRVGLVNLWDGLTRVRPGSLVYARRGVSGLSSVARSCAGPDRQDWIADMVTRTNAEQNRGRS